MSFTAFLQLVRILKGWFQNIRIHFLHTWNENSKGRYFHRFGGKPNSCGEINIHWISSMSNMLWSESPLPDSDLTVPIGTEKEAGSNTAGHIYTYWNCSNLLHSKLCSPFQNKWNCYLCSCIISMQINFPPLNGT